VPPAPRFDAPVRAAAARAAGGGAAMPRVNLVAAVNGALAGLLEEFEHAIVFGEDVAFGGVFRCTNELLSRFGPDRVFNTPLSEQGIVGFGIGYAAMGPGHLALAEIQFADYIYPAYDQLVNEAAKFRYRSGGVESCGGLLVRTPCGAVGHGGHYHSQSPEAPLCHVPGLKVVMPRDPCTAKGLLMAAGKDDNPCVFLEPKALYRAGVSGVPEAGYELPLGAAQVVVPGRDVTVVAWGAQVWVAARAAKVLREGFGVEVEVVDLQTLVPWDEETVVESVRRTGRAVVTHEAPVTMGLGAEVVAAIQEGCFLSLEAPVRRVCGYDTPFPLVHEKYYLPTEEKIVECVLDLMKF